jgi:6-phosphogluconolactonase/glucosamine-6-phosphate isomerase/deaminase
MRFIKSTDSNEGIDALTKRLVDELTAGKHVLWMIPGGSNIPAAVRIMEQIPYALTNFLSITLSDERYGEPGHDNSNWQQLISAGFQGKQAILLPVLISGATLDDVTRAFDKMLSEQFQKNDIIIAQLGIGSDGHISGILPESEATTAGGLAAGYHSEQYTRITTTFTAIEQVTAAYVFAFGAEKQSALNNLRQDISVIQEPAQVLKKIPESFVFNDQLGDHS